MNYIKHLTGFFDRVVQDGHLNPTHISLYIGLFQYWNINRFQNPISITRDEIMRISKICSKATYHKCMRELNDKGYIKYEPSYNPFKGSMVILFNFSDDLKPSQKKDTTSSKILPFDEQAVNKLCTSSGTGAEHAIGIFYKHNTNISNISNNLNLSEHEKNFKNEKSNVLEEEEKSSAKKEEEKEMPERSADEQKYSPSPAFADYSAERTENRRQKSSVKKEKKISSPNQDDVKHFFQSQHFPELEAQKFYNYFSSNGFIRRIDVQTSYSLNDFKTIISGDYNTKDFNTKDFFVSYDSTDVFQALYIAFTPKEKKIIDDVEIIFNDGLNVGSLSEGQKKMLLIKATLEFASSEDTLILLDEPDAHIHINNKEQVVKVFEPYENNRQIIITTHSPTLTQSFKDENVFMLTNGELIKKDRQYIINELTKDFWSKQDQNTFLSLNKDTMLVEGKTDIIHIETALKKLASIDDKYKSLNFKFLPFNGASGLKLFVDEFPVNKTTKTFAFVDRDQAGFDAIKETLDFKGTKDEFNGQEKNGIYINYIPKKVGHTKSDFIIEDYYVLDRYKNFLFENVNCVTEMPNHSSSRFKVKFAEKVKDFDTNDFEGYRKLFDLILEIKNLNKIPVNTIVTPSVTHQNEVAEQEEDIVVNQDPVIIPIDSKTYNHHIEYTSEITWNNFVKLREELLKLNSEIVFGPNKYFVSLYIQKRNFAVIRFRKKSMNLEVKHSEILVKKLLPNRGIHENVNGTNIGNINENEDFSDVVNMLFEVSKIKK